MSNSEIDILVIADNLDNVKLYQIIFKIGKYQVSFVDDVISAEEVMAGHHVKVIVFDCLVVNEALVSFFEKVELINANTQKILVTDYIDHIQISELINRGRIFNYIKKPIDPKRLNVVVHKAIEQYCLKRNNDKLVHNVQSKNEELKHLLAELKEEEETFRNIFISSPDPQFIVDFDGVILDTNPNAVKFCCSGECDCKDRYVFDLVDKEYVPSLLEFIKQIDKGENKRLEVKGKINNDENSSDFELTAYPIKYKRSKALMLAFRDISERKQVQKKMMQTVIQTEEKERRRFAQELHDGIGPLLSTTKLYLQWFNKPQAKVDKTVIISKMEETLDETILSLREVSNNISPNTLLTFGLKAALKNFISRINNVSGIVFEYECNLLARLEQQNEITIYRMVCELINNSLKHSSASLIKINIQEQSKLEVYYEDDGTGFDVDEVMSKENGSGLVNIVNRVEGLGGQYHISSKAGSGTKVEVCLNK